MRTFLLKILFLSVLSGGVAIVSTLFLITLNYFFSIFSENLFLVIFLPLVGWFSQWAYEQAQTKLSARHLTHEGIFVADETSSQNWGFGSAALVFCAAALSQLFGASTGREGVAIQYGASLGRATSRLFQKFRGSAENDFFIKAGMVAGFSSLFGAPIAALWYLVERTRATSPSGSSLYWVYASVLAFVGADFLQAPHTSYPSLENINSGAQFLGVFFLILCVWIAAFTYKKLLGVFFRLWSLCGWTPRKRIVAAGIVIAGLTLAWGDARFNGLGLSLIHESFAQRQNLSDVGLKSLFTLLSLSGGYKGGEVTPLMSIGATWGSFLAPVFGLPLKWAAALSCFFFFGFVLDVPFTAAFLLIEFFGAPAVVPALACAIFYFLGRLALRSVKREHKIS